MALKSVTERPKAGGAPAEETVDALEAARGTAALGLTAIYTAAEQASGQRCSSFHEWEGLYDLLRFVRSKQLRAEGRSDFAADRTACEELEKDRTTLLDHMAARDEATKHLANHYVTERVEMNARNAERQAAFDRKLVAALRAPAPFAEALPALLPEAAEIRECNVKISRHQPNGQINHDFIVNPGQYLQVGDLIELAQRSVELYFNCARPAPDRRTWRRM